MAPGPGGRHGFVRHPCRRGIGPDCEVAGSTLHGGVRQWDGADLECDPDMAGRARGRMALDCAGKTDAERLRRKLDGSLSNEYLNEHLIAKLPHARHLIEAWRRDCNHHRPHARLDGLAPWESHQRSAEDQTLTELTQMRPLRGAGQDHQAIAA
ncbi:hypothetical protein EU805_07780 [Salipiger sp. IMCC34102]|nr:hypothetical protein EU805_07780 [Salipiger sp. IMCC34102]